MPNQRPPQTSQPDFYALFEVLGRNTQMVADIKDNVDTIKSVQANQVLEVAQVKMIVMEQSKDHNELKASCLVHEARTKVLEDREIERKGAIKLLAVLWGSGTALVVGILSNLKTILEFLGLAAHSGN